MWKGTPRIALSRDASVWAIGLLAAAGEVVTEERKESQTIIMDMSIYKQVGSKSLLNL